MLNFDGDIGYYNILMEILIILKVLIVTLEINSKKKYYRLVRTEIPKINEKEAIILITFITTVKLSLTILSYLGMDFINLIN